MTDSPFLPLANSPMVLVTCAFQDKLSGCLVGFSTQCSISPPRYLVCISVDNHTYSIAMEATSLAVHMLDTTNTDLASLFGEHTGDEVNKFECIAWHYGESGAPILNECEAHFEGSVIAKVSFGDHVGFVLAPLNGVDVASELSGRQLELRDVEHFHAGHPITD